MGGGPVTDEPVVAPHVRVTILLPADGAGLVTLAEAIPKDWATLTVHPGYQGERAYGGLVVEVEAVTEPGTHQLHVKDGGWGLQHPFSCRPNLLDCGVHAYVEVLMAGDDAPEPGRYELTPGGVLVRL